MSFWNDETIARLRALWAEGVSTAEIGRRMGISKNAVAGKVHRLNLPARPSPIQRNPNGISGAKKPERISGKAKDTLVVLAGASDVVTQAPPTVPPATIVPDAVLLGVSTPLVTSAEKVHRVSVVGGTPRRTPPTSSCLWPIGEPGTKSFRFCDAEATPGKPYCPEHVGLAYLKVRDRREDGVAAD